MSYRNGMYQNGATEHVDKVKEAVKYMSLDLSEIPVADIPTLVKEKYRILCKEWHPDTCTYLEKEGSGREDEKPLVSPRNTAFRNLRLSVQDSGGVARESQKERLFSAWYGVRHRSLRAEDKAIPASSSGF